MSKEPKEEKPQEIVPWEQIRIFHENMSMAEKALIRKCFYQHAAGNDFDEDLSSAEVEGMFGLFKAGWEFHQVFCKGMVGKYE